MDTGPECIEKPETLNDENLSHEQNDTVFNMCFHAKKKWKGEFHWW